MSLVGTPANAAAAVSMGQKPPLGLRVLPHVPFRRRTTRWVGNFNAWWGRIPACGGAPVGGNATTVQPETSL